MDSVVLEPSLYSIKAICVLDNDGNRLLAKYFDEQFPSAKEQKVFEKNLFNKTHRANAEIIMFEGLTCVYRSNVDLFFYVVGSANENELILGSVLNGFYDAVSQILRRNVEKRALLDNLDAIFLAIDEVCDGGIILDCDSSSIVSKVAIRSEDIVIGEHTVQQDKGKYAHALSLGSQLLPQGKRAWNHIQAFSAKGLRRVLQTAKEQIKWSLLK